jgi:YD repeat-containing protein
LSFSKNHNVEQYLMRYLFVGLIATLAAGAPMFAQSSTQTDSVFEGTTPTGLAPGSPPGSYSLSQIEHYSPFSGTLNPTIPLYHVGGRGEAALDLAWPIAQMWRTSTTTTASWQPYPPANGQMPTFTYTQNFLPPQPWTPAGQSISAGTLWGRHGNSYEPCPFGSSPSPTSPTYTLSKLTFTGSDGTEAELINGSGPAPVLNPCTYDTKLNPFAARGAYFYSTSGAPLVEYSGADIKDSLSSASTPFVIVQGELTFPNGVSYLFINSLATEIHDRNGNQISMTYSNNALSQITDSLGRVISINYQDSSCGCVTITYPGYQGASRVIKIYSASLSAPNVLRSGFSLETYNQLFPADTTDQGQFNPTVLTAVQYPDGREITFQYDSYAELARINLPTGGAVEYDYGDGNNGSTSGYQLQSGTNTSFIYRRLQERREYSNGSTLSSRTHYTVSYPGSTTVDTDVTYDGNGQVVAQVAHTMNGTPLDSFNIVGVACNAWNEGLETQTSFGAPSALRTVVNTYTPQSGCMDNPQLANTTTTLNDTNQVLQISYQYDSYNNITDVKQYGWGSGLERRPAAGTANDISLVDK